MPGSRLNSRSLGERPHRGCGGCERCEGDATCGVYFLLTQVELTPFQPGWQSAWRGAGCESNRCRDTNQESRSESESGETWGLASNDLLRTGQSPSSTERKLLSGPFDDDLDPPVARPAFGRVIAGDRLGLTETGRRNAARVGALGDQRLAH